jgi:hypothetical protein
LLENPAMNDSPPPNPAISWYRTMLWIMPTCIGVSTFLAITFLDPYFPGVPGWAWFAGWFAFNLTATVGLALFDRRLAGGRGKDPEVVAVAKFVLFQFIVPPVILMMAGMALLIFLAWR